MKELSLNILDIVQNSIRADAKLIEIRILESIKENFLKIEIVDDGTGISKEMLKNVTDPYVTSRTTRKVGMGLAFLKQHAELTNGRIEIESTLDKGTKISAFFMLNHIDRQPMGDIAGVMMILIMGNPGIEFIYFYSTDQGDFQMDTREIKDVFEVNSLIDTNLMRDIKSMMSENMKAISAIA